jgi:hypothetical protein
VLFKYAVPLRMLETYFLLRERELWAIGGDIQGKTLKVFFNRLRIWAGRFKRRRTTIGLNAPAASTNVHFT